MMLTTKARYAVTAMIYMYKNAESMPMAVEEMATSQNIETRYLQQIFRKLKDKNLVLSVKGPGGGYFTEKDASEVTIAEIIEAVGESIKMTRCGTDKPGCMKTPGSKCATHDLWAGLSRQIYSYLNGITIADILHREKIIYLDNNATTALNKNIATKMLEISMLPLNASAVHKFGREAKSHLEQSRRTILNSVGCNRTEDYQLIFTSSGSEANNQVINSFKDAIVITSSIEHLSIMNAAKQLPNHLIVEIDDQGLINIEKFEQILASSISEIKLVSIMMANNETGVIQDIKRITSLSHQYGFIVHSDMVQVYGKLPIDLVELDLDIITISAHKAGGPVGVGAIIAKKNINIKPMIYGGGQQKGMRSGTENIPAIVGFAMIAKEIENQIDKMSKIAKIRDYIEEKLESYAHIISKNTARLPNTSCIVMNNVRNETQVINFDLNNIAISAGSACSSGKVANSYVLEAYGYSSDISSCAIRISLGVDNNYEEADIFIENWLSIYKKLGEKNL